MIEACMDGAAVESRQMLHALLAEKLALPPWYGRNLDALYDCLTEPGEPILLRVRNAGALEAALGGYAGAFLRVLTEAEGEGGRFRVEFCGAEPEGARAEEAELTGASAEETEGAEKRAEINAVPLAGEAAGAVPVDTAANAAEKAEIAEPDGVLLEAEPEEES